MKYITFLLSLTWLLMLSACREPDGKNGTRQPKADPRANKQDTQVPAPIAGCKAGKFLRDPETPRLAKNLYQNKIQYAEEALSYFDKLNSKDPTEREFYFRVLTNSYTIADGAYAEGLGYLGKEYIENNTPAFLSFFDNTACFTDSDLSTWAGIVILEFSLVEEDEYDKPFVDEYSSGLIRNCKPCTPAQKTNLEKFTRILKGKWRDYLKHTDK